MRNLAGILALLSFQAAALTLTTEEYPPFNFSTDDGQTIAGQSTEIMREVARRTGIKVTIGLFPWRRAYQMALDDKDTCVFSTTRTEAREKLFKWVGPLLQTSWAFYATADSPIALKDFDDARQFRVGGYQGDAKALYLKENGFQIDEAVTEEQTARKLKAGRIDLWAGDSGTAEWIAKRLDMKIRPVLSYKKTEMYAACNLRMPDSEIRRMNEAIQAMRADGSFERIVKSYR